MRRFGGDLLNSHDIEFDCRALETVLDEELGADLRRQVFLIFKESVHNIVRHSGCRSVKTELGIRAGQLSLSVTDDGKGFDSNDDTGDGHGLASMKKRAQELGGHLQVQSVRGAGTTVVLNAPLRNRYLIRW
jgi:signal transduction histidine kinase